ncbi:RrF2 family transcriptional regulator [Zavarzinia sp. CC-PAN008]|uniref:RrF2 family transcriptional regulator n=1 Tax=Zavarzinia sp. CC-PAN008 TaxID=3243332 RepID=UPI003F74A5DE
MLSQRARYALRALLALAQEDSEKPMLIADIAEQQNVPKKFLELILLDLKRAGFVRSLRGRFGGYALARRPEEISFGALIRSIDGPLAQVPCISKTAYRRCEDCDDEQTCAIRRVLGQVHEATARILDNTSLADVRGGRRADLFMGDGI